MIKKKWLWGVCDFIEVQPVQTHCLVTAVAQVLDKIAVWRLPLLMLWRTWIYDSFTPLGEKLLGTYHSGWEADNVTLMTLVVHPVSSTSSFGVLDFLSSKAGVGGRCFLHNQEWNL